MLDQRTRGVAIELNTELGSTLRNPFRKLPRLNSTLGRDIAARRAHQIVQARRRLELPVLAREEGDRRLGRDRHHGGLEPRQLPILPSLRAVHDDEPVPDRERHRAEGRDDSLGRRSLALEHLYSLGPSGLLRQDPKSSPALGDPAVVIAVDQVGRLETRHSLSGLRR